MKRNVQPYFALTYCVDGVYSGFNRNLYSAFFGKLPSFASKFMNTIPGDVKNKTSQESSQVTLLNTFMA